MMQEPIVTHIPLRERKLLCAKILAIAATARFRDAILDPGVRKEISHIVDRVDIVSSQFQNLVSALDDDSTRLDDFVSTLSDAIQTQLGILLPGSTREIGGIRKSLLDQARAIDCSKCSAQGVCSGDFSHDSIVVQDGGFCIEPLKRYFRAAVNAAHDIYAQFSTTYTLSPKPELLLATSVLAGKPHTLPIDVFAGASTTFASAQGARIAVISLPLSIRQFNDQTLFAIPALLFHECIVHGFQRLPVDAEEAITSDDDPYAEGWMDWVSFKIMQDSLERDHPNQFFPVECGRWSQRLHDARIMANDIQDQRSHNYALCALQGRTTAQLFLVFLRKFPKYGDPWQQFLRFSLELNSTGVTCEQRRLIVSYLNNVLPREGYDNPEKYELLCPGLIRYLSDQVTIEQLIGLFLEHAASEAGANAPERFPGLSL